MPDFAQRSATERGWPRNLEISDHPLRIGESVFDLAVLVSFADSVFHGKEEEARGKQK
jgi:hypothetical protein